MEINFNTDLAKLIKENYSFRIQQLKTCPNMGQRGLSPIGKIPDLKTLLIPVLNLRLMFTKPQQEVINSINEIIYGFLWNEE